MNNCFYSVVSNSFISNSLTLMMSVLSEFSKSDTFLSTSFANSLNSGLFLIHLEPCKVRVMRADVGGKSGFLMRERDSTVFLRETISDRER